MNPTPRTPSLPTLPTAQAIVGTQKTVSNEARFLTLDDIIPPERLVSMPREAYVLLVHSPGPEWAETISREGLRSTEDLAQDPNATADVQEKFALRSNSQHFCNDPGLIYFRPITPARPRPLTPAMFVIAAKADAVYIYDQENRARASAAAHTGSAWTFRAYDDALRQAPPGTYVDRFKAYSRGSEPMYIPECCVRSGRISPDLFVPHAAISEADLAPLPVTADINSESTSEIQNNTDAPPTPLYQQSVLRNPSGWVDGLRSITQKF